VRRYFILATKKCCIYAAFGVLQTPINKIDKKEEKLKSSYPALFSIRGKNLVRPWLERPNHRF
jgi:hypothetical protein